MNEIERLRDLANELEQHPLLQRCCPHCELWMSAIEHEHAAGCGLCFWERAQWLARQT